jgi:hypothetical protein
MTASVLDPFAGDGWHVLHDLAIPASSANIDHVAVTAAGVFVVDSKAWSGTVSDGKQTLWDGGRYPKTHELGTLAWETEAVTAAVSATLPGWPIPVRPVISLIQAALRRPVLTAGSVTAVAVDDLVAHLSSFPPALSADQMAAVAHATAARLPSKPGVASPVVMPAPVPRAPAFPPAPPLGPPPRAGAAALAVRRSSGGASNRRRAVRPRPGGGSQTEAASRLVVVLIIAFVAILIGLRVIGATGKHAGSSGGALRPAGSVTEPAPLHASWSCPTPGQGWTATLVWPAGAAPLGTTAVESAPRPSGPWKLVHAFEGTQPVVLTGIRGTTAGWVRAGNLVTLVIGGTATMQGQLSAPAGC